MMIIDMSYEEYRKQQYQESCVIEVDNLDGEHVHYNVGDSYGGIGEIIGIWMHPESDAVWLVVQIEDALFEVNLS